MMSRLLRIIPIVLLTAGCGSPAPVGSPSAPVIEPPPPATADPEPDLNASPATDAAIAHTSETHGGSTEAADVGETAAHQPEEGFRPPDTRARHDADVVAMHGIRLYESPRLKLYTDIEPVDAEPIPPMMDALFDEWQAYFGGLPPARDGSEFQMTGYLMRDQQRFWDAGLLPVNLPVFAHGKHDGQEFWMNDQEHGYYRRHLLFHEATHSYMQSMGGTTVDVPLWYLEGMAELFATHRLDADGRPAFGIVPDKPEEFVGFGRIEMIEHDVAEGNAFMLPELVSLTPQQFQERQSSYAWSWMNCLLADRNSNYAAAFRQLGRRYPAEGFAEVRREVFDPLMSDFGVEWSLLLSRFDYGHDFESAAIEFQSGMPLASGAEHEATVAANRGWQSSGVRVSPGAEYVIEADGRVTLADEPKPWVSEPQGITIRYADGEPIGRLLGIVIGDVDEGLESPRDVGELLMIGREKTVSPETAGTLYLRVNDFASEVADNSGKYTVRIRCDAESAAFP